MLGLKSKTDPRWLEVALAGLDEVLVDHTHCEHKAAITALSFVSKYPDDPELVVRLIALAAEEADHLRRMAEVCTARGLALGYPGTDPYAKQLLGHARSQQLDHCVDRLLVCALIEARSCERLKLLAEHLADPALAALYDELWRCEAGHHTLFVDLAVRQVERGKGKAEREARAEVMARHDELAEVEAGILAGLPVRPAIH